MSKKYEAAAAEILAAIGGAENVNAARHCQARLRFALKDQSAVNLVFVPMLTFLIMGTLALSLLGSIGNIIGQYLAAFFTFLSENASWAPAFLIGAFLPPMVMFGLHNGVAPLGVMQMSQLGYDSIFGRGLRRHCPHPPLRPAPPACPPSCCTSAAARCGISSTSSSLW